jgi:hypothetical protein
MRAPTSLPHLHPFTRATQIKVPDPKKERRIINCAAAYVDCSKTDLYGPCCFD